jgi:hypothetical protein
VDPVLLYPYEYDWDVPVSSVSAIPVNDPAIGLLIDYSGNLGYGSGDTSPRWGVPTYLTLDGYGNYTLISGANSHQTSGTPYADGDAIDITSCVLDNVTKSVCPLSVTYFNNFTYGVVHSVLSAVYISPPTLFPSSLGGTACGVTGFNAWYDAWAGYVVSGVASIFVWVGDAGSSWPVIGSDWQAFWTTFGCLIGWLVLIIVIVLLIWIVWQTWKGLED